MKYLIMIRHGDYVEGGRISANGRKQMGGISGALRPFVSGRAKVISSTATRAIESAEIIGKTLSLPVETNDILWSEEDHPENFAALLELIRNRQDEADCLILVTHLEYTLSFPSYFAKREWMVEVPAQGIQKGEGILFSLKDETFRLIRKKEAADYECG